MARRAGRALALTLDLGFPGPSVPRMALTGPGGWRAEAQPDAQGRARFDLGGLPRDVLLALDLSAGAPPGCPAGQSGGGDLRSLSVMVKSLRLTPVAAPAASPTPAACVLPGDGPAPAQVAPLPDAPVLAAAQDAQRYLAYGAGWWPAEPFGRWAGGDGATLRLALPKSAFGAEQGANLSIRGVTYASDRIGTEVWFQGRKLAEGTLGAGSVLKVPVGGLPQDQPLDLELRFKAAATACPLGRKESTDARRLVFMLQEVALRPAGQT